MNKLILLLPLVALVALPVAYGATVVPQLEKIDASDWADQQEVKFLNNQFELQTNGLQDFWEESIYKTVASSLGLKLPHPSEPDNRDISTYLLSNGGSCGSNYAGDVNGLFSGNYTGEASSTCKHVIAQARVANAQVFFGDLFTVHYFQGNNINLKSPDLFHERASSCSDIQKQIDGIWGANFDFDDPENQYDKMIRDGMIGKRIMDLENNLPQHYQDLLADHIENNTFVDFYKVDEFNNPLVLKTHPDGLTCDFN